MKRIFQAMMVMGVVCFGMNSITMAAVTVYLNDGTRLEVDKITRVGDSVALFLDISRINTRRTPIEETNLDELLKIAETDADDMLKSESTSPKRGLAVTNLRFEPSADNTEILASGTIENHTQRRVGNIHITVTFMNKQGRVLLTIHGYPYPDILAPGQSGTYAFLAKKPKNFSKASVDVDAETR